MIEFLGRRYLPGRRFGRPFLIFVGLRDLLLAPFLSVRPQPAPVLTEIREAVICKIDYLGDILMAVPAIRLFRQHAPQAKITLVVGEWGRDLAQFFKASGLIDDVVI